MPPQPPLTRASSSLVSLPDLYASPEHPGYLERICRNGHPAGLFDAKTLAREHTLVFGRIQRIHRSTGMGDTGSWFGDAAMAQTISVIADAAERERLMAIVVDRNRPRKHIERARIVLASADQESAQHAAQRIGVSRPAAWRWQQRCADAGSRVCCATRPASPASHQSPPIMRPKWWP
jgi:hypothetical protein